MGYNEKREEIIEGLGDELFRFLDATGFKLIETRSGEDCEATYGSKHIISDALVNAVEPFMKKAFEFGGNNGATVCESQEEKEDDRIQRPVRFIEGAPPPEKPQSKATASEVMLQEGSHAALPLNLPTIGGRVCSIPVDDLAEVAGQAADKFIVEHLKSRGFDMNKEIYREGESGGQNIVYRQRRR